MTTVPIPGDSEKNFQERTINESISDLIFLYSETEIADGQLDEISSNQIAEITAEIIYDCIFAKRPLTVNDETINQITDFITKNKLAETNGEIYHVIGESNDAKFKDLQFLLIYSMHLSFPERPNHISEKFYAVTNKLWGIFASSDIPVLESHLDNIAENHLVDLVNYLINSRRVLNNTIEEENALRQALNDIGNVLESPLQKHLKSSLYRQTRLVEKLIQRHAEVTGKPILPLCKSLYFIDPLTMLTEIDKESFQRAFSLSTSESINFGAPNEALPTKDLVAGYSEIVMYIVEQATTGSLNKLTEGFLLLTSLLLLHKKEQTTIDKTTLSMIFSNIAEITDAQLPNLYLNINIDRSKSPSDIYLKEFYSLQETFNKLRDHYKKSDAEEIILERLIYLFIGFTCQMNGFNSLSTSINERQYEVTNGDRILLALMRSDPKQAHKVIRELRTVKTTPLTPLL